MDGHSQLQERIQDWMKSSSSILVIEHDKEYLWALERAFRQSGLTDSLKVARYGDEAILYLKGTGIYSDRRIYPLPELILLDLANPDGSSMAVLGWIRRQEIFASTPVIIVATEEQDAEMQRAMDSGANACFVKRESLDETVRLISSLLRKDAAAENKPVHSP